MVDNYITISLEEVVAGGLRYVDEAEAYARHSAILVEEGYRIDEWGREGNNVVIGITQTISFQVVGAFSRIASVVARLAGKAGTVAQKVAAFAAKHPYLTVGVVAGGTYLAYDAYKTTILYKASLTQKDMADAILLDPTLTADQKSNILDYIYKSSLPKETVLETVARLIPIAIIGFGVVISLPYILKAVFPEKKVA